MGRYYGLADCHGVESFSRDISPGDAETTLKFSNFLMGEEFTKDLANEFTVLSLRASVNPQRRAVAYRVELDDTSAKEVESLIAEEKYEEALKKIKEKLTALELGTFETTLQKSKSFWDLIPNPSLDPHHS
jgi:hypothetical protein